MRSMIDLSRQGALSNMAATRRKIWLTTRSIESNSARSARSASLSQSDWDWERRSAFLWLATAVPAGGMKLIATQTPALISPVEGIYRRAVGLGDNYTEAPPKGDAPHPRIAPPLT